METKLSNEYLNFYTIKKTYQYTNENTDNYSIDSFTIKKDLLSRDKNLGYQWGKIGLMLLDYVFASNDKIKQIKDDCFHIEKLIKDESYYFSKIKSSNEMVTPVEFFIIHKLLAHLDLLTIDEIKLIKDMYLKYYSPHLISLNSSEQKLVEQMNKTTLDKLTDDFLKSNIPEIFYDLFNIH